MKKLIKPTSVLLAAAVLSLSFNRVQADPEPQPAGPLAWCVAIFAGAMTVGTIVIIRNCRPKYYCIKDRDGNHFVATCTKAERAVNDWTIVSGPYESVAAGTNNCPPPQGQMIAFSEPMDWTIRVQESPDLTNWTTIYETHDDPENLNFTIYPTNLNAARMFYRATATP